MLRGYWLARVHPVCIVARTWKGSRTGRSVDSARPIRGRSVVGKHVIAGKHIQVRRRRVGRAVLPAAATAILTGALAASPLGMAAIADPGPGGDGGHHHDGGGHHGDGDHHGDAGADGWGGNGWDGDHHDGWGWDQDRPAQDPAPAPAPAAAPAAAAPAPVAAPAPAVPAQPAAPAVQIKQFPYTAPVVENDLSGLTLEKGGSGDLMKSGGPLRSDDAVGAVIGTGVALASIGGFAAVLAAGRGRREATP
jgi:hypothetical protein